MKSGNILIIILLMVHKSAECVISLTQKEETLLLKSNPQTVILRSTYSSLRKS